MSVFAMLGMGLAGMLYAQQRITPSDVARLQQQYARDMRELQAQMASSQRESQHTVKDSSVVALEARRGQESNRIEKKGDQKSNKNPRSSEEKAKINEALQEFNKRIPEINASMNQASSNSTLPRIKFKPMTADDVFASAGGGSHSVTTTEQQAIKQVINQRMQEEIKKMDPQTRNQMKAVLKAAEEGKPIPLPQAVPPRPHAQLLPKGTP